MYYYKPKHGFHTGAAMLWMVTEKTFAKAAMEDLVSFLVGLFGAMCALKPTFKARNYIVNHNYRGLWICFIVNRPNHTYLIYEYL